MILQVGVHNTVRYVETWQEIADLIEEVMTNLSVEDPTSPWIAPGENAIFSFVNARRVNPQAPPWPDNYLFVGVNAKTGYGGLSWYFSPDRGVPADDEIGSWVWVSNNPEPPDFDPRVVSEPHYPMFYNPESTIPVAHVRAALEEFCRTGTGDRPSCISWVKGEVDGRRFDLEPNEGIKREP
ncbi:Imm1 family immunity protein [Dactylosporangium sp. NPDC000244]|uniref:Imm1 family immunity protein n=1 Tax=Dactylosporangium sp. NPDC000244 TaxID=3154365 RepID=UPI0033269438